MSFLYHYTLSGVDRFGSRSVSMSIHSVRMMLSTEKLLKIERSNFKRWQQKILFYLTILGFIKFLMKDEPVASGIEVTDFYVRVT